MAQGPATVYEACADSNVIQTLIEAMEVPVLGINDQHNYGLIGVNVDSRASVRGKDLGNDNYGCLATVSFDDFPSVLHMVSPNAPLFTLEDRGKISCRRSL
jgi:hypothetical protein